MSETHKEEPEHDNVFLDRDDLPANQARLIHMLVTDDENENILKVLRLNTLSKLSPPLHALLLTRIQESGWWRNPTDGYGPYSSFDECATEITGFGSSTCNDLVNNWKWWRSKDKTAEEWVRHCQRIGWTACRAIRLANIDSAYIETVVEDICYLEAETVAAPRVPCSLQPVTTNSGQIRLRENQNPNKSKPQRQMNHIP